MGAMFLIVTHAGLSHIKLCVFVQYVLLHEIKHSKIKNILEKCNKMKQLNKCDPIKYKFIDIQGDHLEVTQMRLR